MKRYDKIRKEIEKEDTYTTSKEERRSFAHKIKKQAKKKRYKKYKTDPRKDYIMK